MYGEIVVIKRNGADGAHFPLVSTSCLFGRSNECDIRIQLPTVSKEHCRIEVNEDGQVFVSNTSSLNPTKVNGVEMSEPRLLQHADVITIIDRSFRFEFTYDSKHHPKNLPAAKSPKTPKGESPGKTTPMTIVSPKAKPPMSASPSNSKRPLSLRSENVSPVIRSPVKGTPSSSKMKKTPSGSNPLDDLLDGLSPSSFYKKTTPGRGSKSTGAGTSAAIVSPAVNSKGSPAKVQSPYNPARKDLRRTISDLRRRSRPLTEENLSPRAAFKRVSFGPNLSPEQFDKNLPPKTPIKRGATPRKSLPIVLITPQSLLKRKAAAVAIVEEGSPDIFASQKTASPVIFSSQGIPAMVSSGGKLPASPSTPKSAKNSRNTSPSSGKKSPSRFAGRRSLDNLAIAEAVLADSPEKPASPSPAKKTPAKSPRSRSASPASAKKTPAKQQNQASTPRSRSASPASAKKLVRNTSAKIPVEASIPALSGDATSIKLVSPAASVKEGSPKSRPQRQSRSPTRTPEVATPAKSPATKTPKAATPARSPSPAAKTPKADTPARIPSPAAKTPKTATPARSPSPAPKTPKTATPARSPSPAVKTPKAATPQQQSTSPVTPKPSTPVRSASPAAKTPKAATLAKSPARRPSSTLKSPAVSPEMASPKQTPSKAKSPAPAAATSDNSSVSPSRKRANASPTTEPAVKRARVGSPQATRASLLPAGIRQTFKTQKAAKASRKSVSPAGLKRLMKTPKQAPRASLSPAGIGRTFKTPKADKANRKSVSPAGLKRLMKTPKSVEAASPSGVSRLMKTPKPPRSAFAITPSLSGVARIMKTPKPTKVPVTTTPSPAGLSRLLKTPESACMAAVSPAPASLKKLSPAKAGSAKKTATPASSKALKVRKSVSPGGVKRLMKTPKSGKKGLVNLSGVADLFQTPQPAAEEPVVASSSPAPTTPFSAKGKKTSVKKAQLEKLVSPVTKVVAPPADLRKLWALRVIHGKDVTPKLSAIKAPAPKSMKKSPARKTPGRKLWSDIVKGGIAVTGPFIPEPEPKKMAVVKRKAAAPESAVVKKLVGRTPKTSSALARVQVPTTGHADSPDTLVVGKKVSGHTSKTPNRESLSIDASVEETLYAEIPDTPNGPGEMFVSPISAQNGGRVSSARRSTHLAGVRNLFHSKKSPKTPRLSGIKRLLASPHARKQHSPNLVGVSRIMKTPKAANAAPAVDSPSGIHCLFATPEVAAVQKTRSPVKSPVASRLKSSVPKSTHAGHGKLTPAKVSPAKPKCAGRGKAAKVAASPVKVSPAKSKHATGNRVTAVVESPVTKAELPAGLEEETAVNVPAKGRRGGCGKAISAVATPATVSPVKTKRGTRKNVTIITPAKTPISTPVKRGGRGRAAKVVVEDRLVAAAIAASANLPAQTKQASPAKKFPVMVDSPTPAKKRRGAAAKPASPVKTVSPVARRTRRAAGPAAEVIDLVLFSAAPKRGRRATGTSSTAPAIRKTTAKRTASQPPVEELPTKKAATGKRGKAAQVAEKALEVHTEAVASPAPRRGRKAASKKTGTPAKSAPAAKKTAAKVAEPEIISLVLDSPAPKRGIRAASKKAAKLTSPVPAARKTTKRKASQPPAEQPPAKKAVTLVKVDSSTPAKRRQGAAAKTDSPAKPASPVARQGRKAAPASKSPAKKTRRKAADPASEVIDIVLFSPVPTRGRRAVSKKAASPAPAEEKRAKATKPVKAAKKGRAAAIRSTPPAKCATRGKAAAAVKAASPAAKRTTRRR